MGITPPWLERPGPKYKWDLEPPKGQFWDKLGEEWGTDRGWKIATSCSSKFTAEEIAKIPFDPNLSKTDKLKYLQGLLKEKLAREEEEAGGVDKFKESKPKEYVRMRSSIQCYFVFLHDFDSAEKITRELLEFTNKHPEFGIGMEGQLSIVLFLQRKFDEAIPHGIKNLKKIQDLLGEDSPQSLGALRSLALVTAHAGKFDSADGYLKAVETNVEKLKDGNKYEKYEPEERIALEKTAKLVEMIKNGDPDAGLDDDWF